MSTFADEVSICDLPIELQLRWIYFCDLPELAKLARTCRQFSLLCADEILWRKIIRKSFLPIQGPSIGPTSTDRVSLLWKSLPAKAQCQLISDCKEKNNLKRKAVRLRELSVTGNPRGSLCMHRVVLDDRGVWTSSTETIFRVPWQYKNGSLTTDPTRVERFKRMAGGEFSQNVGDFTLGPHHLITGHWDGSVTVGGTDSAAADTFVVKAHLSDVHSVVLRDHLLVSGSRDCTVSIFDIETRKSMLLANFEDRIWSVAASPKSSVIAVGTSGTTRNPLMRLSSADNSQVVNQQAMQQCNLRLFDLEHQTVLANLTRGFRHGFGILSLQFVGCDTLISGGHDGILRYWDLRENSCTQELDSDLDSAIYCFCTDGLFTTATGHANYNAVCLWDRRFARYPIQTRSIEQDQGETKASCSVYGLCFSPFEVYIGLVDGVYKLPFCS